jgi:peptidoglycan/LPS O-acetylase OafA/YrhL
MKEIFEPYANRCYRYDVQGIRAIGAIIILVYHIWMNKVSGGVDVFFVLSGFLMTGLLLRQYAREQRLRPFEFWGGIVKRIAPSAYLVLLATLIFGYFFLPPLFWRVSLNDLLFSAAHLQNFQLMRLSVDYLGAESPASPFQQFWALSMQVQFYFLLPILLACGIWFARRQRSLLPLIGLVTLLFLLSLGYSLVITALKPAASYFDTGARVWEFLAGALAALILPHLNLRARTAALLSILGLVIILCTGLLIPRSLPFPGFAALLPVTGAVLLLIAGGCTAQQGGASRWLSNNTLVALGSISFTVYLWHWPILVYAQHHHGTISLGLLPGIGVIVAAILLAYLTTKIVENPFRRISKTTPWSSYLVGVLFFLPTVVPALGARQYAVQLHNYLEEAGPVAEHDYFKGRAIALQDNAQAVSLSQIASVSSNKSFTIPECLDGRLCESGDTNSERVVALVGGSHAAQWEPALAKMGERYGFKVVTIAQMSCALGYLEWMDEACLEYNKTILATLTALQPAFVITNSTRLDRDGHSEQAEYVPEVYAEKWREIAALGIPILGIRDNPWFEDNPSQCVWNNLETASQCARSKDELYQAENPVEPVAANIPQFHSVDFLALFCVEGRCPAVFDHYLMYFDTHHFTKTYLEYMTKAFIAALEEQTPVFTAWMKYDISPSPKRTRQEPAGTKGSRPHKKTALARKPLQR